MMKKTRYGLLAAAVVVAVSGGTIGAAAAAPSAKHSDNAVQVIEFQATGMYTDKVKPLLAPYDVEATSATSGTIFWQPPGCVRPSSQRHQGCQGNPLR